MTAALCSGSVSFPQLFTIRWLSEKFWAVSGFQQWICSQRYFSSWWHRSSFSEIKRRFVSALLGSTEANKKKLATGLVHLPLLIDHDDTNPCFSKLQWRDAAPSRMWSDNFSTSKCHKMFACSIYFLTTSTTATSLLIFTSVQSAFITAGIRHLLAQWLCVGCGERARLAWVQMGSGVWRGVECWMLNVEWIRRPGSVLLEARATCTAGQLRLPPLQGKVRKPPLPLWLP